MQMLFDQKDQVEDRETLKTIDDELPKLIAVHRMRRPSKENSRTSLLRDCRFIEIEALPWSSGSRGSGTFTGTAFQTF